MNIINLLKCIKIKKPILLVIALTGFLIPIPYQYYLIPKSMEYNKYQYSIFKRLKKEKNKYIELK